MFLDLLLVLLRLVDFLDLPLVFLDLVDLLLVLLRLVDFLVFLDFLDLREPPLLLGGGISDLFLSPLFISLFLISISFDTLSKMLFSNSSVSMFSLS